MCYSPARGRTDDATSSSSSSSCRSCRCTLLAAARTDGRARDDERDGRPTAGVHLAVPPPARRGDPRRARAPGVASAATINTVRACRYGIIMLHAISFSCFFIFSCFRQIFFFHFAIFRALPPDVSFQPSSTLRRTCWPVY